MNHERGNFVLIIAGIVAVLFLIGFFRNAPAFWDTVNYKKILRLPCGLTVQHPTYSTNEKAQFPVEIDGYINGCGWDPKNGSAGIVQVFDGMGLPMSAPTMLAIPSDNGTYPIYFDTVIRLTKPPTTDTGKILVTSSSGLLYPIPVTF
ncbi:MAG: hypothetical protein WCG55_01290 [bacterium]